MAEEVYKILRLVFIRFSLFSSIFNLIAMTLDRYVSIFHPVAHRNRSPRFVRFLIAGIWAFSFLCVFAVYSVTRWVVASKNGSNLINLIFPASSYPATLIFVYCYTAMYLWIKKRSGNKDIKNEVWYHSDSSITGLS